MANYQDFASIGQDVLEMILYVLFAYLSVFLKTALRDLLKSMLGKGMQFSKPSFDKRSGFCYVNMNLLQLWVKAWKYLPGIEKIQ